MLHNIYQTLSLKITHPLFFRREAPKKFLAFKKTVKVPENNPSLKNNPPPCFSKKSPEGGGLFSMKGCETYFSNLTYKKCLPNSKCYKCQLNTLPPSIGKSKAEFIYLYREYMHKILTSNELALLVYQLFWEDHP